MSYSLLIVTGGASRQSLSALLADKIRSAVLAELGEETHIQTFHIGQYAYELAEKLAGDSQDPVLEEIYEKIYSADGIITVAPVFKASYSGLYKLFWDLTDEGDIKETPVLLAATGGTHRHSLMLDHAMAPLFSFMGAHPVPTRIYATPQEVTGSDQAGLQQRIGRAAQQFAALVKLQTQ